MLKVACALRTSLPESIRTLNTMQPTMEVVVLFIPFCPRPACLGQYRNHRVRFGEWCFQAIPGHGIVRLGDALSCAELHTCPLKTYFTVAVVIEGVSRRRSS